MLIVISRLREEFDDGGIATRPNCQTTYLAQPPFNDGQRLCGGRGGRERHGGAENAVDREREDVRRSNIAK